MNIVSLVNEAENLIDQNVEVEGYFIRPRRKHSDYLFFNIENKSGVGVQAILKKERLGAEKYKQLTHSGLSNEDFVNVKGILQKRKSPRTEFFAYEILVDSLEKAKK